MQNETLKSILDSLTDQERRCLYYAFEHELQQWIKMRDGRYIGVNTSTVRHLIPDLSLSQGLWAVGTIKE